MVDITIDCKGVAIEAAGGIGNLVRVLISDPDMNDIYNEISISDFIDYLDDNGIKTVLDCIGEENCKDYFGVSDETKI